MNKWLVLITAAAVVLPNSAHACRVSTNQTPILHKELPVLPEGAIAVEVEIITDVRSPPYTNVMEARLVSMLRGSFAGSTVKIEPKWVSSCDGFPYPGSRGIVVGHISSISKDVLVIDPIRAPSVNQQLQQNLVPAVDLESLVRE